jgi:hypothetical protein
METNVSIVFKNLIFSSLDNTTAMMELTYENKNVKFSYPLKEPIKITFSPKFISDKVNLTLSVIENINKKTKLAFRSDLVVNKSLFMDGKQIYEKILTLIPLDYKDIKKSGKIYMEMKLLDNLDDGKKNLKSNSKKKNNQKINQNPNKLDDKNEFDDNLSLINVSNIEDEGLQNKKTYFGELFDIDYINKLKNILENDYQRILPTDINSLKNYNQNLYKKYREIGNRYNETIKELNSNNENIRNKAINYFNYYKELKNQLTQRRLELKNKKNKLENEKNINNEDKSLIAGNIENYKNEKEIFLNKLSNPEGGSNDANNLAIISSGTNNSDIKMLSEAIKKISSLGYDIIDGMKISEEERKLLSVIIGTNLCDNIKNEELDEDKRHEGTGNGQEEYDENNMKDDFEFGNKIVALIERDVNELYSRKLIHQVKIDQIDAITYSFSDDDKEKNVSFKIENNNLFCIDSGESFTVWLLSNFST